MSHLFRVQVRFWRFESVRRFPAKVFIFTDTRSCSSIGLVSTSMKSSSTQASAAGTKRRLSSSSPSQSNESLLCSVCGTTRAAVAVESSRALCLLHYYTSNAVQSEHVAVVNEDAISHQIDNGMQDLFAEAYLEIQQEIAHKAALASQRRADPLSIVNDLANSKAKANKKTPPPTASSSEGGFMRQLPLPERLVRTQQQQSRLQREQVAQMNRPAPTVNPYERRKPSRRSIWHIAMQEPMEEEVKQLASITHDLGSVKCSSCGSQLVSSTGNVTTRNSDMSKGETWGSKDRSDSLVTRYECNKCGKIWNEEE